MNNQISCKNKQHINVGTIGHFENKVSSINKGVGMATINTGDWIDPTPWVPEDHERFKKAMEEVRKLNNMDTENLQATCGVLNSKQVLAMKRQLDLIDKNADKKLSTL
jgi:hypothetical protein